MGFDPVPWFVGGGAQHSPEVARLLAFAATGGVEGVVTPSSMKVTPTSVPSGSVQVSVGAALILNRAAASDQQTYVARMATADTVAVAQTSSSGGRSDLIVAQIEDPFLSGEPWQDPADPTVGPYVFTRVISGVPAGTTRLQDVSGYEGRSAVTLARIDIPASTGTVTAAMVKDLRNLARPRETTVVFADLGTSTGTLSATTGTAFPPYNPAVPVPTWATHVRVDVTVAQLQAAGSSTGFASLGVQNGSGTSIIDGDQMTYNVDASVTSTRFVHLATVYGDVRSVAGATLKPTLFMRKSASGQGNLVYDAGSQMVYRITFYEKIV